MKCLFTSVLLLTCCLVANAQSLERPENNCEGGTVIPDGLRSWCQDDEDDFYNECECRYETALKEYRAKKEELENKISALVKEEAELLRNKDSHKNASYKFQIKLNEENNDNFFSDKRNALAELEKAKTSMRQALHIENQIQSLRTALGGNKSEQQIATINQMLESLEAEIKTVQETKPKKTYELSIDTDGYTASETNGETETTSSSYADEGNTDNNSQQEESTESRKSVAENYREQVERNRMVSEAYAGAATVLATGIAEGASEGIFTGLNLSYNMRLSDYDFDELGVSASAVDVPTWELGILVGDKANGGFSVGYGQEGPTSSMVDSGSAHLVTLGLEIGLLSWGELGGSYAFQLSLAGEYGSGIEESNRTDYNDKVINRLEDVSFYGGQLNFKLLKFIHGGYGLGTATGSVTQGGETVEYEVPYSKISVGLRIPF